MPRFAPCLRTLADPRWDLVSGAVSRGELNTRNTRASKRIVERHRHRLVFAVEHGGVIGPMLMHATGARAFAFNGADNGSITHIVMLEHKLIVRRFNDARHPKIELTAGQSQMT